MPARAFDQDPPPSLASTTSICSLNPLAPSNPLQGWTSVSTWEKRSKSSERTGPAHASHRRLQLPDRASPTGWQSASDQVPAGQIRSRLHPYLLNRASTRLRRGGTPRPSPKPGRRSPPGKKFSPTRRSPGSPIGVQQVTRRRVVAFAGTSNGANVVFPKGPRPHSRIQGELLNSSIFA